jgi:23S rRNA pseudouridine1911/1915/1917 synthase
VKRRVPDEAAGERLDRFLATIPEIGSRAAAERLLSDEGVLVDGGRRTKSHRLSGGEELEFEPRAPMHTELVAEDVPLRIAWQDEDLLVVD